MILGGSLLLAPVLAAPRVLPQPPPASGAAPAAVDPALKQAGHPGRQPVIVLLRPSRPDRTALGRSATDAARGRSAFIHRAGPLLSFLGEETAAGRAGPSRALWSVPRGAGPR